MNEIVSTVTEFSESTRQRRELDYRPLPRSAVTAQDGIRSYADLQRLIHKALRVEHPEWIGPDGESEMCDFYEARFAKLLGKEVLARKYHTLPDGTVSARTGTSELNHRCNPNVLPFDFA